MFATECSKPAATKAVIGNTTARILSATVRAAYDIHTARQTSALQRTPSATAWSQPRDVLATPIPSAVSPTCPGELVLLCDEHEEYGRQRADQVARVDDRPVAEKRPGAHAAAGPGHHDKRVPGEELRARDDDEDEPEGEGEPGE